jgi:hypothetical protein
VIGKNSRVDPEVSFTGFRVNPDLECNIPVVSMPQETQSKEPVAMKTSPFTSLILAALILIGASATTVIAKNPTPDNIRALTEEAYI